MASAPASAPSLRSKQDLLELLQIGESFFDQIKRSPERHYRSFSIPKRRGGCRTIEAPLPSLQDIQTTIYQALLLDVAPHPAAHGFVPRRSIISNAACHINGHHFLHLDLENFFGTIQRDQVRDIFTNLGCIAEVADDLSSVCSSRGFLPQGASTSPSLSNLCAFGLDSDLDYIARSNNLTYTRYADDLTFSGPYISLNIIPIVRSAVSRSGFRLNEMKTLLARNGGKSIVTGISVSRGELKLPKKSKRAIRMAAHFLLKSGIANESRRGNVFDPLYVDRILGKLGFWHQIEPTNPFPTEARIRILGQLRSMSLEALAAFS